MDAVYSRMLREKEALIIRGHLHRKSMQEIVHTVDDTIMTKQYFPGPTQKRRDGNWSDHCKGQ
jgi:hypothetical protein